MGACAYVVEQAYSTLQFIKSHLQGHDYNTASLSLSISSGAFFSCALFSQWDNVPFPPAVSAALNAWLPIPISL